MRSPVRRAGPVSVQSVSFNGEIERLFAGEGSGIEPAGPGLRSMQAMLFVAASLTIVGRWERATALAIRPIPGSHQYRGQRSILIISKSLKSFSKCQLESPFKRGST